MRATAIVGFILHAVALAAGVFVEACLAALHLFLCVITSTERSRCKYQDQK
ncbi:MAG TPA: hypothetical protein PKM44_01145 [Turneriella sp.]|nr:hypothetical protein [Turneriella sp.]